MSALKYFVPLISCSFYHFYSKLDLKNQDFCVQELFWFEENIPSPSRKWGFISALGFIQSFTFLLYGGMTRWTIHITLFPQISGWLHGEFCLFLLIFPTSCFHPTAGPWRGGSHLRAFLLSETLQQASRVRFGKRIRFWEWIKHACENMSVKSLHNKIK